MYMYIYVDAFTSGSTSSLITKQGGKDNDNYDSNYMDDFESPNVDERANTDGEYICIYICIYIYIYIHIYI
jgi:hypothetical protein